MKMRWRNRFLVIAAAFILGVSTLSVHPASADSEKGKLERPFKAVDLQDRSQVLVRSNGAAQAPGNVYPITDRTVSLNGVDRSYDFYYYVPKADLGDKSFLQIEFNHSELLIATQSTLTVQVNDKPLDSVYLTKETSKGHSIIVPLEKEDLSQGYHRVSLVKHSLVSDDLCHDQYNPANWLRIEPSSFVYLDTKETWTMTDLLQEYPYPFVERGTTEEVNGVILVPDAPSDLLIASSLHLATALSLSTSSGKLLPIMTESEWLKSDDRSSHVIALGSVGDWQGPIQNVIEEGQNVSIESEELLLHYYSLETDSSKANQLLLLISAQADETIHEKIRILTTPAWKAMLSGNSMRIAKLPADEPAKEEEEKYTLSTFGYEHLLLDEINKESASMFIRFPSYWKIKEGSSLELRLRVSPLLMNQKAEDQPESKRLTETHPYGLTIYLNNIPKTISLSELEPIEEDLYHVSIPLDEYWDEENRGTLELSFSSNINEVGGVCYRNRDEGRWVFVDKESTFHIPHEITKARTFKYWPAPFVNEQGLEQTAFLIPQEVDGRLLRQLSELVMELAGETKNQVPPVILRDTQQLKDQLKQYNMIILGDPKQYAALADKEQQLLIQKEAEYLQLTEYQVLNETTAYVAWLQPSIWNDSLTMLVLQHAEEAENEKGNYFHTNLLRYLKQESSDSQIMLVNKGNQIHSVLLHPEKQAASETVSMKMIESEHPSTIPSWIFIVLAVVFIAILFVVFRMWRRKKRDE